ncbi:hypothetical protein B0H14DRAFT_2439594, partial [Mycena olivaceomarginata]
ILEQCTCNVLFSCLNSTRDGSSWLNPSAYKDLFCNNNSREGRRPLASLYRISSTDLWSVISAFPNNSAPIPRARPPKSVNPTTKRGKPKGLTPKPTPVDLCDPSTCAHALLSYIIKYTQEFTVGPLDYCGITRRIKGRGTD